MLGLSYEQAVTLQQNITNGRATTEEIKQVLRAVLNALIPELPEYGTSTGMHRSYDQCLRRLRDEQKAPIIATNPPMASGFLANHVVLELLKDSGISRSIVRPPHTPGYLYVDAAQMKARKVLRKEVGNEYC